MEQAQQAQAEETIKDSLSVAIALAAHVHAKQVDKGGQPYILHPLRVMLAIGELPVCDCCSNNVRIVAVLHDVMEDSDVKVWNLRNLGFNENICEALLALTKSPHENYDDYIERVLKNKLASIVKLADLQDNANIERIPNPTPEDIERTKKYRKAANHVAQTILYPH